MVNQNIARGLFLLAVSLFFGLNALRYSVGSFSRPGPGLFPLLVSSLLLVLSVLMIAKSRLLPAVRFEFNVRGIGLIMVGLVSFVVVSKLVGMAAGIVTMVMLTSLAGRSHSWQRSLQVSAGLLVVAFAFEHLLGLNLRLV